MSLWSTWRRWKKQECCASEESLLICLSHNGWHGRSFWIGHFQSSTWCVTPTQQQSNLTRPKSCVSVWLLAEIATGGDWEVGTLTSGPRKRSHRNWMRQKSNLDLFFQFWQLFRVKSCSWPFVSKLLVEVSERLQLETTSESSHPLKRHQIASLTDCEMFRNLTGPWRFEQFPIFSLPKHSKTSVGGLSGCHGAPWWTTSVRNDSIPSKINLYRRDAQAAAASTLFLSYQRAAPMRRRADMITTTDRNVVLMLLCAGFLNCRIENMIWWWELAQRRAAVMARFVVSVTRRRPVWGNFHECLREADFIRPRIHVGFSLTPWW